MKTKILLIIMIMLFSVTASAQFSVTKFLGIPVDGFKKDMIKKLEAKGYEYKPERDYLTGEFNGKNVHIFIGTNKNKVCRIAVSDVYRMGAADIKIRFNNLVGQFINNKKYGGFPGVEKYYIGEDVDISYEMTINNKIFQANFFQTVKLDEVNQQVIYQKANEKLGNKYSKEEIRNINYIPNEGFKELLEVASTLMAEATMQRSVWFRIMEEYGRYYVIIFYDNNNNSPNGEDL